MKRPDKMTLSIIIGIVFGVAAIVGGVWWYVIIFGRACNPPLPRQTITIASSTFEVEMATTMAEQACGLSGRSGLQGNEGMLFVFGGSGTQTFWMKDMTFALDMVWISDNTVVGFTENAPPPEPGTALWNLQLYRSPTAVNKVLEVNAGTVEKEHLQIGDVVGGL
jgi:uncharacterized membrane protein (UPF0127 family)